MKVSQVFQDIAGTVTYGTGAPTAIRNPLVEGKTISFTTNAIVGGKAVSTSQAGSYIAECVKKGR